MSELRRLSDAATPGPWRLVFDGEDDIEIGGPAINQAVAVMLRYVGGNPPDNREPNADLIVAAVNYVRSLLESDAPDPDWTQDEQGYVVAPLVTKGAPGG